MVALSGAYRNLFPTSAFAPFAWMDILRRQRGEWLDRLGFGPDEMTSKVIAEEAGMRLRRYEGPAGGPLVLIVPAPIKRHYIWDLHPACSVVRLLAGAGHRVFLVEWTPTTAPLGLDDYAGRLIETALNGVGARRRSVWLAGHSLGGTFAALFAARFPERPRGLLLIEAPLRFGTGAGAFSPLIASTPEAAEQVRLAEAEIPGTVLDAASIAADPKTFATDPWLDLLACTTDRDALARHLRVRRWMLDEFPMPSNLFADVVTKLYRDDSFLSGTLRLGSRTIGPGDIRAPVLAVINPRSTVVPPGSVIPFLRRTGSPVRCVLRYRGEKGIALEHAGPLVGATALGRLWPRIVSWMERFDIGNNV